ncbi:MAG: prolipoprotein diacylglyceryl transferase [Firmicutes bacterium]|nr:prolipoprotein diacylglyceryl transferase [Bacillota bacterium]HPZ90241.1 prolipoprotein diacylglyceryl transferase [Bacillota bacterium]HQE01631.1 prolipoprotein diacylglyceryl transferase [Bacillota bacterium]
MHRVLLEIGPFTVYSYGLMIAIGILAAVFVARRLAPKIGVDPERMLDLAVMAVLGGLLGSYVNYIVSYDWSSFASDPVSLLRFWEGGLVFLGGLIGGTAVAVLYILRHKLPLWEIADIAAVAVPLAYGFGRIGCFLAGCCYGKPCDLPWAVTFPPSWRAIYGQPLVPRHPTQLYLMLLGFALAAFALWFRKRRTFAGQSFLLYLILYGLGRGLIEFLRMEPKVLGTPLSVAQFTGLIMIAVALVVYPILRRHTAYPKDKGQTSE